MAGAAGDTKDITIDGLRFFLTPLDGWRTYDLEPDVIRLMAPAFEVMGTIQDLESLDTAVLAKAANAYAAAMTPGDRRDFMQRLCVGQLVRHGGEDVDLAKVFGVVFQGKPLTRWKVTLELVKVSWPDFFGLFAANAGTATQMAKASSSGGSTT